MYSFELSILLSIIIIITAVYSGWFYWYSFAYALSHSSLNSTGRVKVKDKCRLEDGEAKVVQQKQSENVWGLRRCSFDEIRNLCYCVELSSGYANPR